MKKFLYILFSVLLILSCKKFLDKDPANALPEETAYQKYNDIVVGINGCYKGMEVVGYYGKNFILYPEIASDNLKINLQKTTGRFSTVYNFTMGAASSEPAGLWSAGYDVINRANRIIKALPGISDGTSEQKNDALGEVLAIRALAHFDLVRTFAQPYYFTADASHTGVPIITENNTNGTPPRNTVAEVYTQILNDLSQAATLMNAYPAKPYAFSPASVRALMARVYLYKKDWANAATYAKWVIDSTAGKYSLIANSQYVASWINEFSSESLLELGFLSDNYLVVDALGYELLEGGYGDIISTKDIHLLYDVDDVRKQLFTQGIDDTSAWFCSKYPGRSNTTGLDNVKVIRLSEMYLTAAEALAESGDETNARNYLDAIRQRAYGNTAVSTETGDSLKSVIQKERRKELAFEGHRLFDLTRRGNSILRVDYNPGSKNSVIYPDNHLIMPIPQKELDVNKNMTQNTGY